MKRKHVMVHLLNLIKSFADNNNDLFAAAPKPFFADKQGEDNN